MANNNDNWEDELSQGLKQMDSWITPPDLDITAWERMIVEEQHLERKRLRRELSIFWSVAVVILLLVLVSLTRIPVIFIVIQAIALLGFPIFLTLRLRKKAGL